MTGSGMRPRRLGRRAVALAAAVAVVLTIAPGAATASLAAPAAPADAIRDTEYWLDAYGIRSAWSTTRGQGVTIAVIDTGIAANVPDLGDAVVGGADFSGSGSADGRTPVGENSDHGTLVASLAAGRGTGETDGVIGSAPEADLLSLSIGFGAGSDEQVADAVRWAVDNGADVINMSLTRNTLEWPTLWDDAFLYAFDHDVVVVAAAGNRGAGTTRVGAPATIPGVLTVGGVDRNGVTSFDASSQGITIGVSAPSEQLIGVRADGAYVSWSGTSGATPIVSGVVALVRAAHPELDAANVINRVISTARDAGPPGPDFSYGHGLLDAAAAVGAQVALVEENPLGDLRDWIRVNRRAEGEPPTAIQLRDRAGGVPGGAREPEAAGADWLPGIVPLQLVALPWLAFAVIALVFAGMLAGVALHFRSPRSRD